MAKHSTEFCQCRLQTAPTRFEGIKIIFNFRPTTRVWVRAIVRLLCDCPFIFLYRGRYLPGERIGSRSRADAAEVSSRQCNSDFERLLSPSYQHFRPSISR